LKTEYYLLNKLNSTDREQFVEKGIETRHTVKNYLYQAIKYADNPIKLFEFNYLYKGLAAQTLDSRYNEFDTTSHDAVEKIAHKLSEKEGLIDLIAIADKQPDSFYNYTGVGYKYFVPDSTLEYPVISGIVPFSPAFTSDLQIGDTILDFNDYSVRNISQKQFQHLMETFKLKEKVAIKIKHQGDQIVHTVNLFKDSIYNYTDYYRKAYMAYTFSHSGLDRIVCNAFYGDFINGRGIKIYQKYLGDLSNRDSLYLGYLSFLNKTILSSNTLTFSIDGSYSKLNIETLPIPDSMGNYQYVGDLKKVRLISSVKDLISTDTIAYSNKKIVLFGYPDYTLNRSEQAKLANQVGQDSNSLAYVRGDDAIIGNYSFKPLAATKHEVEDIGQMLEQKGWHVEIYTGAKALKEQIKQIRSPRILHIATHGFFAEDLQPEMQKSFMGMDSKTAKENPMLRSGLAFAGAERTRTDSTHEVGSSTDDGILTAEEAQYLHLDGTELVVLSACETGLGEIVNGEGVYGLQRAFRAAGAKSILMSLWKVDDLATETLMKNFYKHWLEDGMTKDDALWQAKLDLRNDKNHPLWALPYYWGAFVLIGE
jgi:hypothetical protein